MTSERRDFREVAKKFKSRLEKIKLFITDVDGVLTNGNIYWSGEEVGFNRFFHVQDGYGLKMLKEAGIRVAVLSGGGSLGLKKRIENLGIEHYKIGNEDKRKGYLELINEIGVTDEEVLYIGDEFFDLPILKKCGFSVTVPHASYEIQECVDYITSREGGAGCVREVVDILRYAQDWRPSIEGF